MNRGLSTIIFCVLLLWTAAFYAQDITADSKANMTDENYNSWAVGGGLSNFIMHGDLRSIGTGTQGNFFNFGGYLLGNKMFNPVVGLEFKLNFNQIRGGAQYLSDVYDILYISNTQITDDLFFEGTAFGAELNAMVSISNLFSRRPRKLNIIT